MIMMVVVVGGKENSCRCVHTTVPRSRGILKCIMQLAEGILSRDVECTFDDGAGTDEGEVECVSILFRKKEKG